MKIFDPCRGCFVAIVRLDPAVVDGEFLEIGKDGQGEFGGPGVAAELIGRADVFGDVDGRFFRFDEEFAASSDSEAVIRGLGGASYFDDIFMDDILVRFGISCRVVHVPTQFPE